MTQTCLPYLTAAKGNVVNMTSVSGQRPVWGALPYAMAKAAVDQFTRCTSQGKNICVSIMLTGLYISWT